MNHVIIFVLYVVKEVERRKQNEPSTGPCTQPVGTLRVRTCHEPSTVQQYCPAVPSFHPCSGCGYSTAVLYSRLQYAVLFASQQAQPPIRVGNTSNTLFTFIHLAVGCVLCFIPVLSSIVRLPALLRESALIRPVFIWCGRPV